MKPRLALVFVFFNIAAIFFVGVLLVIPKVEKLQAGLQNIRLQERRYVTQNILQAEHENNLREISELNLHILPYEDFAAKLADIGIIAEKYELRQINFLAAEPMRFDVLTDASYHIFEMRVRVSFIGSLHDVLGFAYELSDGSCNIRSLTVDVGGNSRLDLEVSLFGHG